MPSKCCGLVFNHNQFNKCFCAIELDHKSILYIELSKWLEQKYFCMSTTLIIMNRLGTMNIHCSPTVWNHPASASVLPHQLQFQSKVAIMPVNFSPGILEFIVQLSGPVLSQRTIPRNIGVSQGGISKVLRSVQTMPITKSLRETGFSHPRESGSS